MSQAYPLAWPQGWPRTPSHRRKRAQFGKAAGAYRTKKSLTIADAIARLQREMDSLKASDLILSTNVELRLDGMPRSDRSPPHDVGVAVYFTLNGKPHCMPCDRWDRVADNIAAIAKHLEATRGIARWGVADTATMFTGFQALPAPKSWRAVMHFREDEHVSPEAIEARYRWLAKKRHPDQGGSNAAMAELNTALAAAREELAR